MQTMGTTVGPALADQLISTLGRDRVSVQGVDYTATIYSNALRGSQGGPVMAQLANSQLSRCPNTKIAISGYSQGAMVVHYAVANAGLSPAKVSSAVLYGDPQNRQSVGNLPASKTKVSLKGLRWSRSTRAEANQNPAEILRPWRRRLRDGHFQHLGSPSLLHQERRHC